MIRILNRQSCFFTKSVYFFNTCWYVSNKRCQTSTRRITKSFSFWQRAVCCVQREVTRSHAISSSLSNSCGYNVGCFLCCFCYMKITIFVELRQCYESVITCSPTVNDVYDQTSSGCNDALCWLTCCSCCLIGPETLRCACIICCWICKRWYAWKKETKQFTLKDIH